MDTDLSNTRRSATKVAQKVAIFEKNEEKGRLRQLRKILKTEESLRSSEDVEILHKFPDLARELCERKKMREIQQLRKEEKEDDFKTLNEKCCQLAKYIKSAKHLVIYTGAGISTAASIPDYRGPNGVWTKLYKGEKPRAHNLCKADPTLTHMSIAKLYQESLVKHVVSQNCDGLHVRSGLTSSALSEVHGNMFVEYCDDCDPEEIYWRRFDVTERTSLRRHQTGRHCVMCGSPLLDTIIHFGEKREIEFPQRWQAAIDNAKLADTILCLGSSLKVLKRYHVLWGMNRPKNKRPTLLVVNLQWTPKDSQALVKINGRCDEVMRLVMTKLNLSIPLYSRDSDPVFGRVTPLLPDELDTFTSPMLLTEEEMKEEIKGRQRQDLNDDQDSKDTKIMNSNSLDYPTQPGWFGKGLGKLKKRRKRLRSNKTE